MRYLEHLVEVEKRIREGGVALYGASLNPDLDGVEYTGRSIPEIGRYGLDLNKLRDCGVVSYVGGNVYEVTEEYLDVFTQVTGSKYVIGPSPTEFAELEGMPKIPAYPFDLERFEIGPMDLAMLYGLDREKTKDHLVESMFGIEDGFENLSWRDKVKFVGDLSPKEFDNALKVHFPLGLDQVGIARVEANGVAKSGVDAMGKHLEGEKSMQNWKEEVRAVGSAIIAECRIGALNGTNEEIVVASTGSGVESANDRPEGMQPVVETIERDGDMYTMEDVILRRMMEGKGIDDIFPNIWDKFVEATDSGRKLVLNIYALPDEVKILLYKMAEELGVELHVNVYPADLKDITKTSLYPEIGDMEDFELSDGQDGWSIEEYRSRSSLAVETDVSNIPTFKGFSIRGIESPQKLVTYFEEHKDTIIRELGSRVVLKIADGGEGIGVKVIKDLKNWENAKVDIAGVWMEGQNYVVEQCANLDPLKVIRDSDEDITIGLTDKDTSDLEDGEELIYEGNPAFSVVFKDGNIYATMQFTDGQEWVGNLILDEEMWKKLNFEMGYEDFLEIAKKLSKGIYAGSIDFLVSKKADGKLVIGLNDPNFNRQTGAFSADDARRQLAGFKEVRLEEIRTATHVLKMHSDFEGTSDQVRYQLTNACKANEISEEDLRLIFVAEGSKFMIAVAGRNSLEALENKQKIVDYLREEEVIISA